MYRVIVKRQILKGIAKMPELVQKKMNMLIQDLSSSGPIQKTWPNYSKLGEDRYHCHLAQKWVACWRSEKKSIIIEVYYAGSRENAPY